MSRRKGRRRDEVPLSGPGRLVLDLDLDLGRVWLFEMYSCTERTVRFRWGKRGK
jgi:hypothetical protein